MRITLIQVRRCKHCKDAYIYYPETDPRVARDFCSPECYNCDATRNSPARIKCIRCKARDN